MRGRWIKFWSRFSLKSLTRDIKGFTLIEMLTVAAIIAILATMAVASMRGGKTVAFESMCVGALKHISEAEHLFYNRNNRFADWDTLVAEGDLIDPGYSKVDNIRNPIDTPIAMMYSIRLRAFTNDFRVIAYPIDVDTWKLRTFGLDSDGSILNNKDNPGFFSVLP